MVHSDSPGPTVQVDAAGAGGSAAAAGTAGAGAESAGVGAGAESAAAGAIAPGSDGATMTDPPGTRASAGVVPGGAGALWVAGGRAWTAPATVPRLRPTVTTSTAAAMRAANRSVTRDPAPATVSPSRTRTVTERRSCQQQTTHETQATMARRSKRPWASKRRGTGRPTWASTTGTATKTTRAALAPVTRSASLRRTVGPSSGRLSSGGTAR